MSLLMDALRKAEQQKQKLSTQGQETSEQGGLALEPISKQEAPTHNEADNRSALPELPSSLEALDEQFLAHAAQSRPTPTPHPAPKPLPPQPTREPPPLPTKPELARDSARNVFDAKQPQPRNNRNFAIAIGLTSLFAAIGMGGYFWWQLQPKGSLVATPNLPPAPSVPMPAPAVVAAPPAALPVAVPPAPTFSSPLATASMGHGEEEEEDVSAAPKRKIKPTRPAPPAAAAPEPESPVRRTSTAAKTDPLLIQAHEAYGRGESTLARHAWLQMLAKDPLNLDALRGLAVVAQQNQQWGEAASYYQRALDVDPKDAIALAGLMALRAPTDMIQAESRLKTLLAEQPDSAYLNFALGNQYARQQRWADAQQAYFKAYTVEPANAGYAFNLAVSLDQLHQAKLAARYYNEALAVTERQPGQPTGFDRIEVINRLNQLQAAAIP
ncbi:MAG: tetratricopeptide repeat protein [Rhodocyclaceae bacterium]|nr:tetratricopeptide repeat protein [Rhodocyclaceae bacterium]MDZ4213837.1 tetratricopeptide repeat protein [Rhodocyclaceae bacterium]